jgi:hypothetical protein
MARLFLILDAEDKVLFVASLTAGVDLNLFSGWFAGAKP